MITLSHSLCNAHTKALIFSWNSFSLSVRWLNFGLSSGVRAQHHPINTNLEGGGGERRSKEGEGRMGGGGTREGRRGKGKERGRRGGSGRGEGG